MSCEIPLSERAPVVTLTAPNLPTPIASVFGKSLTTWPKLDSKLQFFCLSLQMLWLQTCVTNHIWLKTYLEASDSIMEKAIDPD